MAVGLVSTCLKPGESQPKAPPRPVWPAMARAVDGQTFRAGRLWFVLWGIDAPPPNTIAGRDAKHLLNEILQEGMVTCQWAGRFFYDRMMVTCATAYHLDVAAELVRHGAVLDCPFVSHGYYRPLELDTSRDYLWQSPACEERTQ